MSFRRRTTLSFASPGFAVLLTAVSAVGAITQSPVGPLLAPASESVAPVAAVPPTVADQRAENAERIRVAERRVEGDPQDAAAVAELATYKTAETLLAQQEAVEQQIAELTTRQEELQKELKAWAAPPAEPVTSFSFIEFDRLVNRLAAEKARTELVRSKLKAAKAALEQGNSDLNAREQERRKAQEAFEAGKTTPDAAKLAATLDDVRRSSLIAADTLALRKRELEREKLSDSVQTLTVELLQGKVDRYQPLVIFTDADLKEQLKKLDTREEAIRSALETAERDGTQAAAMWSRAKRSLETATGDKTVVTEEVEAWQRAREQARERKNTALDQLLQVDQLRTAWNRLFRLMSGTKPPTPEELNTWKDETASTLKILIGSTQSHLLRIDELRNELATVFSKFAAAKDGPAELRTLIDSQRGSIEAMIRTHEANLVSIDASRRLHGKLRTELSHGIDLLSPEQWAHEAWASLVWVWDYEIAANGDLSVTVGKILRALIVFAAGWLLSRMFSQFFAHRLLKRFRLSKDATAVIRTLIFYSLVMVAGLIALRTANVPLTAFTILGGAVAIGVGFGSQALINNFISGLIMLAERPVRIGERVLFGNYDGVIEDVGFRCTKLRTGTDHLVTIPNSALVNDSIENVGRRRTIQRTLNLQITYDTPRASIAAAVEALRDILEEPGIREPIHPVIGWDKHPPKVFFNDFNADSLNLQLSYHFAPPDQGAFNEHAQKVNFRIFEEFERLGVSFAFPSRTVYLANDTVRELRMRLTSEDAA
jgi:potassium-dependent mechanosensitive channel